MSYTLSVTVDIGSENTGATLNGQLYGSNGSTSGSAITTGIVELGSTGIYQYVATLADGFVGSLLLYKASDTTIRAAVSINPAETENADAKVSTLATSTALTAVSDNVALILADTGTDGVVLSSSTLNAIADALLKRSVSNVESTASTHSLAEIILAMLESSAPSTTWTIRKTDGTTFNTRTLTELAGALPVVGVT